LRLSINKLKQKLMYKVILIIVSSDENLQIESKEIRGIKEIGTTICSIKSLKNRIQRKGDPRFINGSLSYKNQNDQAPPWLIMQEGCLFANVCKGVLFIFHLKNITYHPVFHFIDKNFYFLFYPY